MLSGPAWTIFFVFWIFWRILTSFYDIFSLGLAFRPRNCYSEKKETFDKKISCDNNNKCCYINSCYFLMKYVILTQKFVALFYFSIQAKQRSTQTTTRRHIRGYHEKVMVAYNFFPKYLKHSNSSLTCKNYRYRNRFRMPTDLLYYRYNLYRQPNRQSGTDAIFDPIDPSTPDFFDYDYDVNFSTSGSGGSGLGGSGFGVGTPTPSGILPEQAVSLANTKSRKARLWRKVYYLQYLRELYRRWVSLFNRSRQ